ncbi:hypothetical protein SAMN07250955_11427 [Arboricoccus pini]|uniref:Outer membrane protein beta-barrel domain-containing protein n=1 Tax=Arboricoccus pini TaxID=1963835 RepID=A0A212RT92_9PROT|nr:hypothetical protein [Arboricoccus pini]SNB75879.1 hypothetical protein SAMN07250955_11427 [Arboricoccus pini]
MTAHIRFKILANMALTAALLLEAAPSAHALSLVEGRYIEQNSGGDAPVANDDAKLSDGNRFNSDRFVLRFTPRDPMSASLRQQGADDTDLPNLRISMEAGGAEAGRLDLMNIGPMPGLGISPANPTPGTQTLAIGGAVELNDWAVGATFLQSSGLGLQAEMAGASLGYGRLTSRLAIGEQSSVYEGGSKEFYLFSTDLAARPWLSLEGDLGFTPAQQNTDQSAVGRVGVRLKF